MNLEKKSKASDTMGTKHRVGFAVYKVMGSVNVQLAEKQVLVRKMRKY